MADGGCAAARRKSSERTAYAHRQRHQRLRRVFPPCQPTPYRAVPCCAVSCRVVPCAAVACAHLQAQFARTNQKGAPDCLVSSSPLVLRQSPYVHSFVRSFVLRASCTCSACARLRCAPATNALATASAATAAVMAVVVATMAAAATVAEAIATTMAKPAPSAFA